MIKRFFDLLISALLLIITFPLMIIIALTVFYKLKSFPLFCQKRPGLNGTIFNMYKFKTMLELYDEKGNLLSDEYRLTAFGKFLRSTSLDELPELWNVLKGDMSLVGPRPLLTEYLPLYNQKQQRRHEVRPGITGWAQVNGRNQLSWQDKFNLDVWYVDHQNLWLDIKILYMTFKKVVIRDGIHSKGKMTVEKFFGNES